MAGEEAAAAAAAATEHSHVHVDDLEVPVVLAPPLLAATEAFARILAAEPEAAVETGQRCPVEVAQAQSAHAAADLCGHSCPAALAPVEEVAAGSLRILAVAEAAAVASEILRILAAAHLAADCFAVLVHSAAGSLRIPAVPVTAVATVKNLAADPVSVLAGPEAAVEGAALAHSGKAAVESSRNPAAVEAAAAG